MCLDPRVGIQRQRRLIMPRGQADVTRPSRPWRAERERERDGYDDDDDGDGDDDADADDNLDDEEHNDHDGDDADDGDDVMMVAVLAVAVPKYSNAISTETCDHGDSIINALNQTGVTTKITLNPKPDKHDRVPLGTMGT